MRIFPSGVFEYPPKAEASAQHVVIVVLCATYGGSQLDAGTIVDHEQSGGSFVGLEAARNQTRDRAEAAKATQSASHATRALLAESDAWAHREIRCDELALLKAASSAQFTGALQRSLLQ